MEIMLLVNKALCYMALEALYFSKFWSLNILLKYTTIQIVIIFKNIRTGHELVLSTDLWVKK